MGLPARVRRSPVTRYLVATSSVHVTAAAADYLQGRLEPSDDVTVVAVREPDAPSRDAVERSSTSPGSQARQDPGDAANVARSRLAAAAPGIDVRDGDPTEELLAAVEEYGPDEVLVGANRGTEDAEGVGSTARALLADLDRPVVIVPVPDL